MLGPEFGTFRWLFRSSMKLQVSVLQKLGSQGYRQEGQLLAAAEGTMPRQQLLVVGSAVCWVWFDSLRFDDSLRFGYMVNTSPTWDAARCLPAMSWTHRVFQDFLDICCVTMICSCWKQQLPHKLQPTEPLVSRHLLHMDNILSFASSASSAFFFWSIWNYLKLSAFEVGFVIGFLYFSQETIGNPEIHMN